LACQLPLVAAGHANDWHLRHAIAGVVAERGGLEQEINCRDPPDLYAVMGDENEERSLGERAVPRLLVHRMWRTSRSRRVPACPAVLPGSRVDRWHSRDRSCPEVGAVSKRIWRRPGRVAIPYRHSWLLVVALVWLLAAACTSPDSRPATPTSQTSTGPTHRDYWPTAGWRTATPGDQGMDPAVVGELDTKVSGTYPQVRSLLIIRHGYLVYERYWHGVDASDGHNTFSVTKSLTSALIGIALRERHLKGLDQTVGELLATHLPRNADPRLRRVTVRQLLTMTAGLAGDDPKRATTSSGPRCWKAATGSATS
jgi:hypothetical protein